MTQFSKLKKSFSVQCIQEYPWKIHNTFPTGIHTLCILQAQEQFIDIKLRDITYEF